MTTPLLKACGTDGQRDKIGGLNAPDENRLRLPSGFQSHVIARSSEIVTNTGYLWHAAPDGGACFPEDDGGWIYVSNSELEGNNGGVSAIKFSEAAEIVEAYSILSGTNRNCSGGATPWGTWLSCEELTDKGRVFECDPKGLATAIERPALGYFKHEATAYDTFNHQIYLTEDEKDGRLYRFTPSSLTESGYADLSAGVLESAEILNPNSGDVTWHVINDPLAEESSLRYQSALSSPFNGGEGIYYFEGTITFVTKGDNQVWCFNIVNQQLVPIYTADDYEKPILTGVDNITINSSGDVFVAEDKGDMQIVILYTDGTIEPLAQLIGHDESEITGLAFNPDQTRLYFSSQRGVDNRSESGVTYVISGPFIS
jgi:secreted PhoX family phosphatase